MKPTSTIFGTRGPGRTDLLLLAAIAAAAAVLTLTAGPVVAESTMGELPAFLYHGG